MDKFLRYLLPIFYYPIKIIVLGLFITLWRIRFFNFVKLKDVDNSILISNHQSFLDPVLICLPLPYIPIFLARQTLLESSIVRYVSKIHTEIIFFDRDNFSLSSFKTIVYTLKKNRKSVVIFPEGTRSAEGSISNFKRGFTILSKMLKRNVHAFYIEGTHKVLGRNRTIPALFVPISIYYLKKFDYNINSFTLWKEVNEYYRRVEETYRRK